MDQKIVDSSKKTSSGEIHSPQQPNISPNKRVLKWVLAIFGLVVFGGLFGAGTYGIMHSFDLFGGPSTPAEKLFSSFAAIGLIGGIIYFSLISFKFTEGDESGNRILKTIGYILLYMVLIIPLAFASMVLLDSQSVIERVDYYLVSRNESQRQGVIGNTNINIIFKASEVISYGIDKEFSALVFKGQLLGLDSASQISSYMNIIGLDKLTINNKLVSIPKPDQWTNMPSTISLGTDEPPHVSFSSATQDLELLVIVPAESIQLQAENSISGSLAIWSQSENTFDQEIIWRQEINAVVKNGKNPQSENVLRAYLTNRLK